MVNKSRAKRKLRTREHINADLSVNHVERIALLKDFSVERVEHDYGYDLIIFTYDKKGEIENGQIYFQLKAQNKLSFVKDGFMIAYQVEIRDIDLWREELFPVIFVVYDTKRDVAYWLHVQEYLNTISTQRTKLIKRLTLHIPVENVLDVSAMASIAGFKASALDKIKTLLNQS